MQFRFKALSVHLLASCMALTLILGALYLGWYRWPGWYLADVTQVVAVITGVDLVVGPLLTFVIASPRKPRRVLARDIAVIIAVQLLALGYGTRSLWNGRPLYYAFSEDVLQLVQAYDIDADDLARARHQNLPLAPHWYSLPRWIWAPLPADSTMRDKIIAAAISGGADVIALPDYYKPWASGVATLRARLKRVDDLKYFSGNDKVLLKKRMQAAGFATDRTNAMALTGRGRPLLAVFDPASTAIVAIFKVK